MGGVKVIRTETKSDMSLYKNRTCAQTGLCRWLRTVHRPGPNTSEHRGRYIRAELGQERTSTNLLPLSSLLKATMSSSAAVTPKAKPTVSITPKAKPSKAKTPKRPSTTMENPATPPAPKKQKKVENPPSDEMVGVETTKAAPLTQLIYRRGKVLL